MLTNTKQWADHTINLFKGKCDNGCIYCYRTADIERFNENPIWTVKEELLFKKFQKREGVTMYPSGHDIKPGDIHLHVQFLKNFLKSGSKILIVTKANLYCIGRLCHDLNDFKEQIEFRFTIGSVEEEVLQYYEPFAPTFLNRMSSLMYAFRHGYKTSVSIEPMLDTDPYSVVREVYPFVTESIWVGKMNQPKQRVTLNRHTDKLRRVTLLSDFQANDENILKIVKMLSGFPKIQWKDSILKVIDKYKTAEPCQEQQ